MVSIHLEDGFFRCLFLSRLDRSASRSLAAHTSERRLEVRRCGTAILPFLAARSALSFKVLRRYGNIIVRLLTTNREALIRKQNISSCIPVHCQYCCVYSTNSIDEQMPHNYVHR